jgi:hypothetical protein
VGGSTEDPAQDVTFSGRTVKWQGVHVRRCALGRITVKAETKDKSVRARERLRGPHRGVFRRDGKGSRRRYGHRLYTGCIRTPSVRTNPIAELFSFLCDDLIYRSFEGAFSRSATRLRRLVVPSRPASTDADNRCGKGSLLKAHNR